MNARLESLQYDDAIVRKFPIATFVPGLVGMTVGLLIALQLALTGRIDPLVAAVRVPWSSLTVVLISWRACGFPGAGRCA